MSPGWRSTQRPDGSNGSNGSNGPDPVVRLVQALGRVPRPNAAVVCWHWRWELAAATTVAGAGWLVVWLLGPIWGPVTAAACTALLATSAALRRQAVARYWCVITQHRFRRGCAEAWVHNRSGKLPIILWASPWPEGTRLVVWCRAGTAAADLEAARPVLTAACWATDVEVYVHPTRAQLVTVHVVRQPTRLG